MDGKVVETSRNDKEQGHNRWEKKANSPSVKLRAPVGRPFAVLERRRVLGRLRITARSPSRMGVFLVILAAKAEGAGRQVIAVDRMARGRDSRSIFGLSNLDHLVSRFLLPLRQITQWLQV